MPVTPVTGTWPAVIGGTYFLVVSVSAADDTGSTVNVGASGGCLLVAPTVNYVVSTVAAPGGSVLPAGTLTSSFQLSNTRRQQRFPAGQLVGIRLPDDRD